MILGKEKCSAVVPVRFHVPSVPEFVERCKIHLMAILTSIKACVK